MSDSREQLQAYLERLHNDFPFFYSEIMRLYKRITPSDVQLDMARWCAEGPKRRGILAMRGVGKTEVDCAYDAWRLAKNPTLERIMTSCQSTDKAKETLHLVRGWIETIPFLRHLKPDKLNPKARDSSTSFDVPQTLIDKTPSFQAIGLTGSRTGGRATFITADDVETPENTLTREQRQRLADRFDEFEHIASESNSEILVIGTYHHEESLYTELMRRGYEFRAYPLIYPDSPDDVPSLAPLLVKHMLDGTAKPGDPVFPFRFGREYVTDRKLRISKRSWAMQLALMPSVKNSDRNPLKLSDLIVLQGMHRDVGPTIVVYGKQTVRGSTARQDIPNPGLLGDGFFGPAMVSDKYAPYQRTVCMIDPAGSSDTGDEMAWSIMSQLHGLLFWKHVDGVKGGATPENLDKIALSCRQHGVTDISGESNFGGDTILRLLEPRVTKLFLKPGENPAFPNGWTATVHIDDPMHSTGQKELRITNRLDPIMRQHRLIVSESVARDAVCMQQLAFITNERGALDHDDRLESASMCADFFKDSLYQDAESIAAVNPDEEIAKIVEAYRQRFHPPHAAGWIQHGFTKKN